jgi:hypothetical protein
MPEIKTVIVQTSYAHPDRGDPGGVEIGYYFVVGRDLTMTDESGKPMTRPHRLGADDDPHVIAGRLTRERWLKRNGTSDFNRRLHSQPLGTA